MTLPDSKPSDLLGGVPEWSRRKDAWGDWTASLCTWDLFGGLTFDPRRARHPHVPGSQRFSKATRTPARLAEDGSIDLDDVPIAVDVARSRVRDFLNKGESRLGRRLRAVVALEAHRSGWPHFHPLLSIEGGLERGDIAELGSLWYQACGYNRLEVPRNVADVAKYASKYLVKGLDRGDVLIWPEKGPMKYPERGRLAL